MTEKYYLSLLETDADVDKKGFKLQIPQRCTTSNKGPLLLHPPNHSHPAHLPNVDRHALCTPLPPLRHFAVRTRSQTSKRRSLTRFPVVYMRRPIEVAVEQLSTCNMSSREFQENVKSMKVLSEGGGDSLVQLPQLLIRAAPAPTTTHSPYPSNFSNTQTVTHYNSTAHMNVTITFSKQGNRRNAPFQIPMEDHTEMSITRQSDPPPTPPPTHTGERRGGKLPYVHVPLAPPSLNAVLIHQQYPVTAHTRIKGTRLH